MTTAAIRAQLAARGIHDEPPFGCTWCGEERSHHGRRWAPIVQMHSWEQPSQAMILERMRRRRANRLAADPAKYHATIGWADDGTGESADPYCADCKTDGCPRWMRIQARLDEQRWGISRNPRSTSGGWGGDAAW